MKIVSNARTIQHPITAGTSAKTVGASDGTAPQPRTARRQRLLEDLRQLFFAEGFLHFTMDEIAERLRCSKKTLYHIAASQDDLLVQVIERYLADIRRDGWAAVERVADPLAAMKAYMDAALRGTQQAGAAFHRDLVRWPRGRACVDRHQRERADGLARLLTAAAPTNGLKPSHAKFLAEVMLAAAQRLMDPDLLSSVNLSVSEGFGIFYRTLEYGLLPRSASPPARRPGRGGKRTTKHRRT